MSDILQTIFSPACLFTGYVIALPIQILYDGLLAYIIPPKSKRAYWIIVIAVAVVLILFRPLYPTEIRGMLGIFQSIVLPICLMTGSVPKRVIVCSLAMVLMAAAELTGAVIWVSSTGLEMMNDQLALAHAPLTIFMGLVGYGLVMTPAMLGMGKVVHRFFPDARRDQRSSPASGAVSPVWMRRLALFPLMPGARLSSLCWVFASASREGSRRLLSLPQRFCCCVRLLMRCFFCRCVARPKVSEPSWRLPFWRSGWRGTCASRPPYRGSLTTPRVCVTTCATIKPWWRRCASAGIAGLLWTTLRAPLPHCARCGWMLLASSRMRSTEFPWGRACAPRERKGGGCGCADDGASAQASVYAAVCRYAYSNALLLASAEGDTAEIEESLLDRGGVPLSGSCCVAADYARGAQGQFRHGAFGTRPHPPFGRPFGGAHQRVLHRHDLHGGGRVVRRSFLDSGYRA